MSTLNQISPNQNFRMANMIMVMLIGYFKVMLIFITPSMVMVVAFILMIAMEVMHNFVKELIREVVIVEEAV